MSRARLIDRLCRAGCTLAMIAALIVPTAAPAGAFGSSQVGTSGAVFLKIGPGARPAAMGEAFTGVADDVNAVYYNPAGLATLKNSELTAMHMQWFQNVNYEYAAFAYPTEKLGTFGMAVTNLHTDDINARTEDTDAATGQFSSSDSAYWLSYAYPLTDRLSLGTNAKYIRQVLDSTNANAYAVDGGILYDTEWKGLKFGGCLQNVGSQTKFVNESDPLPLTIRLGSSIQPIPKTLILSSDLLIPRDHQVGVALGSEYHHKLWDGIGYSVRSGYRSDSDVSGFSGVSVGGGLDVGRASFDFGWVPFGDLGNTYRFGLTLKFGPVEPEPEKSKDQKVIQKAEDYSDPALDRLLSN